MCTSGWQHLNPLINLNMTNRKHNLCASLCGITERKLCLQQTILPIQLIMKLIDQQLNPLPCCLGRLLWFFHYLYWKASVVSPSKSIWVSQQPCFISLMNQSSVKFNSVGIPDAQLPVLSPTLCIDPSPSRQYNCHLPFCENDCEPFDNTAAVFQWYQVM